MSIHGTDERILIMRLVAFIEEWGSWGDEVPDPSCWDGKAPPPYNFSEQFVGTAYEDAKAYLVNGQEGGAP